MLERLLSLDVRGADRPYVLEERAGRGRCLIAKSDIAVGALVLEERVALWRCAEDACIFCTARGHSVLRCDRFATSHAELLRYGLELVSAGAVDEQSAQGLIAQFLVASSVPGREKVLPLALALNSFTKGDEAPVRALYA